MQYVRLPGTGLSVSKACLGTMTFGGQVDEATSIQIIHKALDLGINFVDTADLYVAGESERITGKALKDRRSKVILATKGFNPTSPDVNDRGLSRRHLTNALEDSLRRLGTDYVDIYYLHQPDHFTPIEETMDTVSQFVREGKVRYIGVSNFAAWQISDLIACADKRNGIAPVIAQNVYNQITRGIEEELIPMTKAHNLTNIVYNPLAAGLLTGKHTAGAPAAGTRLADNKQYHDRYWSDSNFQAASQLAEIAAEIGMTPASFALRWAATQPEIHSVLIGMSRPTHLEENLAAVEAEPLPQEILQKCDAVWSQLRGSFFRYYR